MIRRMLMAVALVVGVAGIGLLFLYRPIAATHPALTGGQLPDLVPLRAFYADSSSQWRFRLSPDGKRIAWLESKWFRPALWVRDLDADGSDVFRTPDRVRWYTPPTELARIFCWH